MLYKTHTFTKRFIRDNFFSFLLIQTAIASSKHTKETRKKNELLCFYVLSPYLCINTFIYIEKKGYKTHTSFLSNLDYDTRNQNNMWLLLSSLTLLIGGVLTLCYFYGSHLIDSFTLFFVYRFEAIRLRTRPHRLIFVRHGQSQGNVNLQCYATIPDSQLKLTDLGQQQALDAGQRTGTPSAFRDLQGSRPRAREPTCRCPFDRYAPASLVLLQYPGDRPLISAIGIANEPPYCARSRIQLVIDQRLANHFRAPPAFTNAVGAVVRARCEAAAGAIEARQIIRIGVIGLHACGSRAGRHRGGGCQTIYRELSAWSIAFEEGRKMPAILGAPHCDSTTLRRGMIEFRAAAAFAGRTCHQDAP